MEETERLAEKERLDSVKTLIREQIRLLEQDYADSVNHLADINADMWENAHHLIYDFDDVVELQQRSMEMTIHGGLAKRSRAKLLMLRRMLQSPYFGRIDFAASNQPKPSQVYIGINSLTAPEEVRPRVFDWRAPICSMFYDFGTGEASYVSPSGVIRGVISLKRQYKIRDGEFEYLLDSDIKIDDEILQRELSLHSESRLRTIVNSIQREQNYAIRYDADENLTVFGAAGSGKTSIGLHRLAYQLYHRRGRIASENMLVISQSDIFSSYIADIIPELGEEDIARVSFRELLQRHLGAAPPDACELMEYVVSAREGDVRMRGLALKYSPEFLDFMRGSISGLRVSFHAAEVFREAVCTGAELTRRFAAEPKAYSLLSRLRRLGDYVCDRIEDYFIRNADEIKTRLLAEAVDANDLDGECSRMLAEARDEARRKLLADANLDAERLYRGMLLRFIRSKGDDEAIYADTAKRLESGSPAFEDALALLYVKLLTGEVEPDRAIRHVLIDEAQDFSLLQHRIIQCYAADSRFTVLADVEQAMLPVVTIRDKAVIRSLYGGTAVELTRSYRSTLEINALASGLLDRRETAYFERSGSKPRVLVSDDAAAAIRRILSLPECRECRSVGIITKTAKRAEALHGLLGREDIGLIASAGDSFRPGAQILPVTLAKGLEFDCVVIPDCTEAEFHTPTDRRMLYLMCTRALHHLFFTCAGGLTGFIAPQGDRYDVIDPHMPIRRA